MQKGIVYRSVRPEECGEVVALHRSVFPAPQIEYSIYASHGVDRYLAHLITFTALQKENTLLGAWDSGELVGYAHSRALPTSWHLNYVGVLPSHRGCGIGSALVNDWLDEGHRRGHHLLTVDVDAQNAFALKWYTRRGMRSADATWMYQGSLLPTQPSPATLCTMTLLDWEIAEACHALYGFSQFRLTDGEYCWTVGRLGKWFRLTERMSRAAEEALASIDPTRELLLLSSQPLSDPGLLQVGLRLRMETSC